MNELLLSKYTVGSYSLEQLNFNILEGKQMHFAMLLTVFITRQNHTLPALGGAT